MELAPRAALSPQTNSPTLTSHSLNPFWAKYIICISYNSAPSPLSVFWGHKFQAYLRFVWFQAGPTPNITETSSRLYALVAIETVVDLDL